MNAFHVTYRYTNPRAAISHVIATMEMWVGKHISPSELVAVVEGSDSNLRVIGLEAKA